MQQNDNDHELEEGAEPKTPRDIHHDLEDEVEHPAPDIEHHREPDAENMMPVKDKPGTL